MDNSPSKKKKNCLTRDNIVKNIKKKCERKRKVVCENNVDFPSIASLNDNFVMYIHNVGWNYVRFRYFCVYFHYFSIIREILDFYFYACIHYFRIIRKILKNFPHFCNRREVVGEGGICLRFDEITNEC